MKLSWHPVHKLWCKVIGKRIAKDGKRLVQAQWYFPADRQQAEDGAGAIKQQWVKLKRTWDTSVMQALGDPFPNVPHWHRHHVEAQGIDFDQLRAERDEGIDASEVAEVHSDMTLDDLRGHYVAHRKEREGVDFQQTTNKSFETDLNGAMRFISGKTVVASLPPSSIGNMRAAMVKAKVKRRTMRNFGVAFKAMLTWYWKSEFFRGGERNVDAFDEEFGKFPKLRAAKPVHLSTDVLAKVFAAAKGRRRLYLMLMLNIGMQPTDIASVQAAGFDLASGIVTWQRKKNQRIDEPSEVIVVSKLWPETVRLVQKFIANGGLAFRKHDGGPLSKVTSGRNRNNAVTKSMNKLWDRLKKKGIVANVKSFRTTGAQFIHEASDYDLSRVWMGRGFAKVDQSYLTQTYARLDEASEKVRQRLTAAGVFAKAGTDSYEKKLFDVSEDGPTNQIDGFPI
jgi:hypothetical protein